MSTMRRSGNYRHHLSTKRRCPESPALIGHVASDYGIWECDAGWYWWLNGVGYSCSGYIVMREQRNQKAIGACPSYREERRWLRSPPPRVVSPNPNITGNCDAPCWPARLAPRSSGTTSCCMELSPDWCSERCFSLGRLH